MSSSSTTGNTSQDSESGRRPQDNLRLLMDQRKRRRMESNRESAKRSRMRKQKHVDDLMAQAAQLRRQNHEVLTSLTLTTQHHGRVEAENSVLRAQAMELTQRLHSLNGILDYMGSCLGCNNNDDGNNNGGAGFMPEAEDYYSQVSNRLLGGDYGLMMNMNGNNMMGFGHNLQCPIVASADLFGLY